MYRRRVDSNKKKMADEGPRKVTKKSSFGKKPVEKDTEANKKQLEASIRTQVAAEEKAHRIVEQLVLENSISENYLLEIGSYITPSHYSDIVEERAIAKVCGYPLCSKALTQVPSQRYKISVKTNRVFDITERKKYCSNFCYKASKYFESQIPSSPVWTRIGESPKNFSLLKATDSFNRPSPGELLVGSKKSESHNFSIEDETSIENSSSNSSNNKTGVDGNSLHDAIKNSEPDNADHSTSHSVKETVHSGADVTSKLNELAISTTCRPITNIRKEEQLTEERELRKKIIFPSPKERDNDKSAVEKEESLLKVQTEKDSLIKEKSSGNTKELFLNSIKDTLSKWFTDSTHRYLCMMTPSSRNVDTLEDNKDTKKGVLGKNERQKAGDTNVRFPKKSDSVKEFNAAGDGDDDNQAEKNSRLDPENMKITEKNAKEGFPCVVPPIDSKSQLTIRRQIVLHKLTQVLPEILVMSPHNKNELITHFTALVRTFRLDSQNTMFKPLQWKVLATTLIHLLEKHHKLKGDGFNREKMLVNLGLTMEDMNTIVDSLSRDIQGTVSYEVPSQDTYTREQHSDLYSRMEDLD